MQYDYLKQMRLAPSVLGAMVIFILQEKTQTTLLYPKVSNSSAAQNRAVTDLDNRIAGRS
ncbi:MAG: hypothetical protein ACJAS3_001053 [Roseivirga sp.]